MVEVKASVLVWGLSNLDKSKSTRIINEISDSMKGIQSGQLLTFKDSSHDNVHYDNEEGSRIYDGVADRVLIQPGITQSFTIRKHNAYNPKSIHFF